jgi:VWFA-related protein
MWLAGAIGVCASAILLALPDAQNQKNLSNPKNPKTLFQIPQVPLTTNRPATPDRPEPPTVSTPQRPVFRAGAVLVTVDAYPQRNGQIVEGLGPADFEVLEDGKPQRVETFDFVRVEPVMAESARIDPNTVRDANTQAADPRNRVFVAFLDSNHVRKDGSWATRKPLIDTLNHVLAPNDLFGVMTPKMQGRDIAFGRKLLSIEDQLARAWPWGERDSIMPDAEDDLLTQCVGVSGNGQRQQGTDGAMVRPLVDILKLRYREDQTLTSIESMVRFLAGLREARTDVLMFTDGWVLYEPESDQNLNNKAWDPSKGNMPNPGIYRGPNGQLTMDNPFDTTKCIAEVARLQSLDDKRRFRDLLGEASRANITFYPVNPGGLAAFDTSMSESVGQNPLARPGDTVLVQDQQTLQGRIENLRTMAENTDGFAVVNTNDVAGGLAKVVNDVSAYYLLGYYSTNTKFDGRYRRIQVKTAQQGVTIKARRGYLAPSEANAKAGPAAANAATPQPDASLVEAAIGVLSRLRDSAEILTYGIADQSELTVVAEIPGTQIAAGRWTQGGELNVVATGPGGEALGNGTAKIDAASRGALVRLPLPADAKGPWRVSVVVSSGGDRLEDRVSVDRGMLGKLLNKPVVYRAAPGPRSPLRPVADFQFRRTERVHVEWPEIKALDQHQARLLNKSGQPVPVALTLTERPRDGQGAAGDAPTALALDLNLAPLGPGDYVIDVTAGAGTEVERRLLAIRVIQ